MTTFSIDWHLVGFIVLLIAILLTGLLAFLALFLSVVRLFARQTASSSAPAKQAPAAEPMPNHMDMEKLADTLAGRIRATPSINFPNHPAMTAVAEVLQKSARTEAALNKVVQAVTEANETAAGTKAAI